MTASQGTIVLAGAVARRPAHGGHAWAFLQYLLGFRELGWDVMLLDWIERSALTDGAGTPCAPERSIQVRAFLGLLERFGLAGSLAISSQASASGSDSDGSLVVGLDRASVIDRVRRSTALVNVMGYLRDEAILAAAPLRVFLDIDPGYPQMWRELGLHDAFAGHDAFVTVGANIGQPDCAIPTCGLDWITTRPPVVLSAWPFHPTPGPRGLTSVVTWRSQYGTVEYGGHRYGPRAHEFRQFAALPGRTGQRFELALDIEDGDCVDRDLLIRSGWHVVNPRELVATPDLYRGYIHQSAGEMMVAQNMYVQTRSGWFSDRSVCYLASGRPVLAQDTGLREQIGQIGGNGGNGDGLRFFTTMDEAAEGVIAIAADPVSQSRAARAVAEQYFDAAVVLRRLLKRLRIG